MVYTLFVLCTMWSTCVGCGRSFSPPPPPFPHLNQANFDPQESVSYAERIRAFFLRIQIIRRKQHDQTLWELDPLLFKVIFGSQPVARNFVNINCFFFFFFGHLFHTLPRKWVVGGNVGGEWGGGFFWA